jgi:hypothetical protein
MQAPQDLYVVIEKLCDLVGVGKPVYGECIDEYLPKIQALYDRIERIVDEIGKP